MGQFSAEKSGPNGSGLSGNQHSAFIDRLHAYLPGWEVEIIRGEMFSAGYGFVVDYLAEILRHMRNEDFSGRYKGLLTLSSDISTRDRDGVNKTFSGLMKLIFPGDDATDFEIEEMLKLALEGRKRVKDQLRRIDSTYPDTDFSFTRRDGQRVRATTLEEREYPDLYGQRRKSEASEGEAATSQAEQDLPTRPAEPMPNQKGSRDQAKPSAGHHVFAENQKGITFHRLFWPWLQGAKRIVLTDPYIRLFHQARNLMEFVEMIATNKALDEAVSLHLITAPDVANPEKQESNLIAIKASAAAADIEFSWEYDQTSTIHARHVVADTGWKIGLDRGLDIFQRFELNDAFSLQNRAQAFRAVKGFEITYIPLGDGIPRASIS